MPLCVALGRPWRLAGFDQCSDPRTEVVLRDLANSAQLMVKMQPMCVPRTLPVVLSLEKVGRLIVVAGSLKELLCVCVTVLGHFIRIAVEKFTTSDF